MHYNSNVLFIAIRAKQIFAFACVAFIDLAFCLNNGNIKNAQKTIFVDSAGMQLSRNIDHIESDIYKDDTSPMKDALIMRTILGNAKNDNLDTLQYSRIKLLEKYSALFKKNPLSNKAFASFEIIPTVRTEAYDACLFYTAIIRILTGKKVIVYDSKSIYTSEKLIQKELAISWEEGKSISDGIMTLCFDSTQIWICEKQNLK